MRNVTLGGSVLAAAMLVGLWTPIVASAQSELDTSDAQPFLGDWVVSMDTDFGPFTMGMEIADQGGKVAATLTSPEMGSQSVTDIMRDGESLVLAFEADAQGQIFDVSMTLDTEGDGLSVWFEVGGGEFAAAGVATRSEG